MKRNTAKRRSFKQLQIHVLRSLDRHAMALIPLGGQH